MSTIFMPTTQSEVWRMLPASVQAEWVPVEHEHWTANDARQGLCQLALDALRACRTNARYARLCVHDTHVCMRINGTYKQQSCIAQLECYMTTDELYEFLSHSGMPCLAYVQ